MNPRTPPPADRHRRHRRSPGWWTPPRRRRSCRARIARSIGLPLATALCLLAVVLVLIPAVIA